MSGDKRPPLEVVGRVSEIVRRVVNVDTLDEGEDLVDAGLIDSLAFVELLVAVEQEFGLVVSLDDLSVDDFRSVSSIARLVAAGA